MKKKEHKQKAVIYWRIACSENHYLDHSQSAQIERCKRYADLKRYEVIDVFGDNVSGNVIERPGVKDLLDFLNAHRTDTPVVLIDDIARLARDLLVHMKLREMIDAAGGILESPAFKFGNDPASLFSEQILLSAVQWQHQMQVIEKEVADERE